MFEIGEKMSIEGCYCGLSVICELNDHAMSGTALPERMKEGYLSVILELRNSCATKTWNASVYFLIICFVKEIAARLMCELYKVHFLNLTDMNGNVNEEALGQYHVDFLVGVVQAFLAMLSWI